jgi:hypothetical protein
VRRTPDCHAHDPQQQTAAGPATTRDGWQRRCGVVPACLDGFVVAGDLGRDELLWTQDHDSIVVV